MFNTKKCPSCAEKINKKYNYCPWCGQSIKMHKEAEDFGLIGRSDFIDEKNMPGSQMGLPFGLEKMVGPLIKELQKELSNLEKNEGFPRGFNIKIHTGNPQQFRIENQKKQRPIRNEKISESELERRKTLPKQEAESKIKRIADKIIYEIKAPGVKNKEDISITRLEHGFEIKVYTKDACFTKTIPLQVDIEKLSIKKDQILVELKN